MNSSSCFYDSSSPAGPLLSCFAWGWSFGHKRPFLSLTRSPALSLRPTTELITARLLSAPESTASSSRSMTSRRDRPGSFRNSPSTASLGWGNPLWTACAFSTGAGPFGDSAFTNAAGGSSRIRSSTRRSEFNSSMRLSISAIFESTYLAHSFDTRPIVDSCRVGVLACVNVRQRVLFLCLPLVSSAADGTCTRTGQRRLNAYAPPTPKVGASTCFATAASQATGGSIPRHHPALASDQPPLPRWSGPETGPSAGGASLASSLPQVIAPRSAMQGFASRLSANCDGA